MTGASKEEIGRRVRELRLARELSQAALAEAIGTKQPNIARIEAGNVEPTLPVLRAIASEFGIDLGDLVRAKPPG